MESADPSDPKALSRVYAAWRCRTLAGAIVATAVGLVVHGPMGEVRFDFGGEWLSPWLLLGLVALVVGAFGLAQKPITIGRLVGVALLAAGVFLVVRE